MQKLEAKWSGWRWLQLVIGVSGLSLLLSACGGLVSGPSGGTSTTNPKVVAVEVATALSSYNWQSPQAAVGTADQLGTPRFGAAFNAFETSIAALQNNLETAKLTLSFSLGQAAVVTQTSNAASIKVAGVVQCPAAQLAAAQTLGMVGNVAYTINVVKVGGKWLVKALSATQGIYQGVNIGGAITPTQTPPITSNGVIYHLGNIGFVGPKWVASPAAEYGLELWPQVTNNLMLVSNSTNFAIFQTTNQNLTATALKTYVTAMLAPTNANILSGPVVESGALGNVLVFTLQMSGAAGSQEDGLLEYALLPNGGLGGMCLWDSTDSGAVMQNTCRQAMATMTD